jgi:hypothetical protein
MTRLSPHDETWLVGGRQRGGGLASAMSAGEVSRRGVFATCLCVPCALRDTPCPNHLVRVNILAPPRFTQTCIWTFLAHAPTPCARHVSRPRHRALALNVCSIYLRFTCTCICVPLMCVCLCVSVRVSVCL